ncbi:MAG: hypothetical protein LBB22_04495 [Treponema sp.]|jgi:hypothetical protein|nr:hypothetical protein [Treponema sp.]
MRKTLAITVLALFVGQAVILPLFADAGFWEAKEREMRLELSEAYYRFVAGGMEEARALIDKVYAARCYFNANVNKVDTFA